MTQLAGREIMVSPSGTIDLLPIPATIDFDTKIVLICPRDLSIGDKTHLDINSEAINSALAEEKGVDSSEIAVSGLTIPIVGSESKVRRPENDSIFN